MRLANSEYRAQRATASSSVSGIGSDGCTVSSSATSATTSPAARNWRATSTASAPPKDQPPRATGRPAAISRIRSRYPAARSSSGPSVRSTPYTGVSVPSRSTSGS